MKIARPPTGFKISVSEGVKALVQQQSAAQPLFAIHWKDILDRLRFTAHVEGVADDRFQTGCRLWVAAADEERLLPRVTLVYLVLGDRVTIKIARIG